MQGSNRIAARSSPAMDILAADPARHALFLDVDGTLLDIAPVPDQVAVPQGLVELLARLSRNLDGAVAILTGRQLAEIDTLLVPIRLAGAGVHGAELRLTPEGKITASAPQVTADLVDELTRLARRWPGVIVEAKGPGLSIHYRLAPDLKPEIEAALAVTLARHRESRRNELVICEGRKLFEVVPAGHSKGTALATLFRLPQFQGRVPVMIGDDVGDEGALLAAQRLGGAGLRVAGEHFRRTEADFEGPQGVVAWLTRLAERIEA